MDCPFHRPEVRAMCATTCTLERCQPDDDAGPAIGSLFSGYGGLEMGIQAAIGGRVVWHVENDDAPSRILAHHHAGVPNYGDVTLVEWATLPPVEVLCGGFPCQDLSGGGNRAGLKPGTRSGLWLHFAYAIAVLQPAMVIIENVRGLLDAEAHSDVEPCSWCLGDDSDEPCMRALGAVLADLARIGYDAEWCGLRASDVGAPHNRFRVFIVATRRDAVPDAGGQRHGPREDARGVGRLDRDDEGEALERERPRQVTVCGTPAHIERFGAYGHAVARWEGILGRDAPDPVDEPAFLEWMMGLPAGHVTGIEGVSADAQMKALGNGVVPQQAAAAIRYLLAVRTPA